MQPSSYKNRQGQRICDPTGYWMSEKRDGMKGRWVNGHLQTRSGKRLTDAPDWFLELFPKNIDLDGELYFGRGTFEKTGSLRSTSGRSISGRQWDNVEFHVFDVVDYRLCWIERQGILLKLSAEWTNEHRFRLVQQRLIKSKEEVERVFQRICNQGGEGIILADPWGIYEDGKVEQILKYKKCYDREAIIIGYNTDDSGLRMASFLVRPYKNGKINKKIDFNIGTGLKKKQRYHFKKKYPIGTVVTYTYELMGKNGKPRTPVFKGVRSDMD
jgi:DNA ligase-1